MKSVMIKITIIVTVKIKKHQQFIGIVVVIMICGDIYLYIYTRNGMKSIIKKIKIIVTVKIKKYQQ